MEKRIKIGVSGASGVGKTTLSKAISEKFNIAFITGSARMSLTQEDLSELMSIRGLKNNWSNKNHLDNILNSLIDPPFGLELQNRILNRRKVCLESSNSFITDRTPIDNMVYFMMQNSVVLGPGDTINYINSCVDVLLKNFDVVFFIRTSGMEDVEDDGLRINNLPYQMMIDNIFKYITSTYIQSRDNAIPVFEINTRDLGKRVEQVSHYIETPSIQM